MATIVNIYDAKTQLSKLVKRARAGEEIVIADAGRPVVKLVAIEQPRAPIVLGGDRGKIWVADDAFAPMTEAELSEWYDNPIFPPVTIGQQARETTSKTSESAERKPAKQTTTRASTPKARRRSTKR